MMRGKKLDHPRFTDLAGAETDEDVIDVGPGCSLGCRFCPHGQGKAGHPLAEILSPSFKPPDAHRVTIMAGDLVRPELAPLVTNIRRQGTSAALVYAHPGLADPSLLGVLARAGLTGIHLLLPAAERQLLERLTNGSGSIARTAKLIDTANELGLDVALEIPVVASNAFAIGDTVHRALNRIARPDRIILRFLAEFDPVSGAVPWNHSLAIEGVQDAIEMAGTVGVPLVMGHPHAPPPCVLNLPAVTPELYSGFTTEAADRDRKRPFSVCQSCTIASVCPADGRFLRLDLSEPTLPDELLLPKKAIARTADIPPETVNVTPLSPAQEAGDGNSRPSNDDERMRAPDGTSSITLFIRQMEVSRLIEEFKQRGLACRYPWEQLEAHDIRGVVTPCAGGWPLESTINACTSWHWGIGLLSAWNSPGMQATRNAIANNQAHTTCKLHCPAFHGGPQSTIPNRRAPATKICYENVVANMTEMLNGATILTSKPQSISFSPTMQCPNRCRMCDIHEVREVLGNPPEIREMPDRLFDELVELLPTTRMLALTGGEPLVSSRGRELLRMFRADRFIDGAVTITTNGLLLRAPIVRDLSATRIKTFFISLNAATDDTYAFISGTPGGFSRVMDNLHGLLNAAPRMAGHPSIVVSFVVMRSNYHELPAFLDLADELKVGVRLLPVERDRMGESIFTDLDTLDSVIRLVHEKVLPIVRTRSFGQRTEVAKLLSILNGRREGQEIGSL